jgi:2,3-bisphosphoglycerate-dependent phosphoglycerate mutase/probable phosphoglycerate mutase
MWQGWSDAPLSPLGLEQAREAGRALAAMGLKPGMVASSDLLRARHTAELIVQPLGYRGPLVVVRDLREQDLGEWNGLTHAEIEARWPEALDKRSQGDLDQVPGGERGTEFVERCVGAFHRLVGTAVEEGAQEAVVVSHGGVIMSLEKVLGGWEPGNRYPNLGGWWVQSRGAPPDLELELLERVDLLALAPSAEPVTDPA